MSGKADYRDEQRIDHMLNALESLVKNANGAKREMLELCDNTTKALIYDLIVLGEAANNISDGFAKLHQEIEWADIAGLRHKHVHDYAGIDFDTLWNVVRNDIPALLPKIKAIHKTLSTATLDQGVSEFIGNYT